VLVRLGVPGVVGRLEVDTAHFKGNYPDRCAVFGIWWPGGTPWGFTRTDGWAAVLPESKLGADRVHTFDQLPDRGPFTHLRLDVLPCGGVSRFRAWGRPAEPAADPALDRLDALEVEEAVRNLLRCCGSNRWARAVAARRPFLSRAELYGEAEVAWWAMGDGDWREAFTHHPPIGADVEQLRHRFATTADLSAGEQAAVRTASDDTLTALAEGNQTYLDRFGHLFIACAAGRSADEMLALLRSRLDNDPDAELRIAAGEQAKITRLRLEKVCV
jgi:allantoicase